MEYLNRTFLFFLSILLFSGCASQKKLVYFQNAREQKLDTAFYYSSSGRYELKIAVNDIIGIAIQGVEASTFNFLDPSGLASPMREYERGFVVDRSGNIEMPYIGKVRIKDLTLAEATDTIKARLALYIDKPAVMLKMLSFYVHVIGEVARPGVYQANAERMTIIEALAKAGDLTSFGNRRNIKIVRESRTGGKNQVEIIDLTAHNIIEPGILLLQPNDIIYVEPLGFKRIQSISPFISISASIISITLILLRFAK